jgi:cytochrome c oxidase assembly factor CtaG
MPLDPLQLTLPTVLGLGYARRALTLRRRGHPVPSPRVACFILGIAILAVALASPLHELGERRLSFHMAQHVLLGDLAPLFLLAGLTGPLLRPLLALGPLARLRALANPLVALPLWAANLVVWHLPVFYDAAVRHDAVHVLEHASFFAAGIALWLPVLETLPAPAWFGTGAKIAYVVGAWVVGSVLGNVLLWAAGSPLYGVYAHRAGVDALEDQRLAGAVMLGEGLAVAAAMLAWLALRLVREAERRQRLLEDGAPPAMARRAVRYGRRLSAGPRTSAR